MKPISLICTACFCFLAPASLAAEPEPLALKPLPNGVHGHSAALLGDQWVAFGGYGLKAATFDGEAGTWKKFPGMKRDKVFFQSEVVDGKLYAVGGLAEHAEAVIEKYDSDKERWDIVLSSKSLPKSHFSTTVLDNKIYVVGGFPVRDATLQVFDAKTGKLLDADASPPPIPGVVRSDHFHYVAVLEGQLHVLGGMRFEGDKTGPLKQHWKYNGKAWEKLADLPKPSIAKSAAYGVMDDELLIFNVSDGLHHKYDPKADKWTDTLSPMPADLYMAATVVDTGADRLVVLGGTEPKSGPTKAIHVYDVKANKWSVVK